MEASSWLRSSTPTPQQEGEEMNVSLKTIKTVNFKISKHDTVGRLKALVCAKEGIPECFQELFFNGNHLENDRNLVDYGICDNSTLNAYVGNLVPLRLTIKIPSIKRTVWVEARTRDTIQHVKALIEAKEKIPSADFSLVYAGKLLEEDKTLAYLEVTGGSTLHVVFNPRETLQISVKMLIGETVKIQVRTLSTILDVKTMVESKVGYPVKVLAHEGNKLEDSKTLLHYNIADDSILEMLPPSKHIFIKFRGKSISFEVHLKDKVRSLKEKIHLKLGVPVDVQKLVFEGKILNDNQDLATYRVENDCNIDLSFLVSMSTDSD